MAASEEHVETVRNADPKLLDAFWKLVDLDEKVRLSAAERILIIIKKNQECFEGEGTCPDLSYCLERLVKGLGSTRKAARQGFAVLLTEVLRYKQVSLELYFSLVEKHIPLTTKQLDVSSAVIGRTLAYSALIRSGRLKTDPEALKTSITTLRKLCVHRPYVEQVCSTLLVEIFSQLEEKQFKELVWPELRHELSCGWSDCTPEQLFLLLSVRRYFPNVLNAKSFLSTHWGSEEIIHPDCLEDLGKVLKKSTSVHPLVHSACDEVLKIISNKKGFKQFWNKVVNEMLLQSSHDEKVYLGFQLIKAILPQLKSEQHMSVVLSPAFQRVFTKAAFNKQHTLNQAALDLAEFLSVFVKQCHNSLFQFKVLQLFASPPGSIFFDHITKRKTFAALVSNLQEEAVHQYAELAKRIFLESESEAGEESSGEAEDPQRTFAVHQLATMVKHPAVADDGKWQKSIVEFLLVHAFFEIKKPCDLPHCSVKPVPISESLRKTCQELFYKVLEAYSQSKKPTSVKTRLECEVEVLKEISEVVSLLLNASDCVTSVVPQKELMEAWNNMLKMVENVRKKCKKGANADEGSTFQLLFYFLGFQLLDDPQHTRETLEELEECWKRASNKQSSKGGKASEPLWSEVLVDLMLSLLPNANHVMRSCLSLVFSCLIPHMTPDSLRQILDVIDPSAASEDKDSEPLVEESDDDDDDDGTDEKMDNSDEESSESDEEQDDDDSPVDEELRKKVKLALGDAADKSDNDSEVYLSDSEMMKLDGSLAEAFKQHSDTKPKFSKKENSLLTFRLRCLDFIMAYLKSDPPLSRAVQVIKPILAAAKYGARRQMQEALKVKALHALELLLKCKKNDSTDSIDTDELKGLLQFLMAEAKKATDSEVSKIVSRLCAWTISVDSKLKDAETGENCDTPDSSEEWYLPLYQQSLDEHFSKNNTDTHPDMFISFLSRCPQTSIYFIQWLKKYILSENMRTFKKTEALRLFLMALKSCKSSKRVDVSEWSRFVKEFVPELNDVILKSLADKVWKRQYVSDLLEALYLVGDISESVFHFQPLKDCSQISEALKSLPRSKRRLLMRRSQNVIKKIIRMAENSSE